MNASNVSIGTLTIARGGTGYDSYVEGQILMANTVGGVVTLTKLTPGTSGHFLKSQGAGSHLEWASVADIGSATPGQLIMGDYLTGGPTTLAEDTTIHADATTTNTAGKLVARDDLGDIYASNVSSSSNVNAITLKANVIASNVVSTDIYGTIQGSNTVTAITVTGNVAAGNVVSTDIYGTIKGSNTVTAITLNANVISNNIHGEIRGSNTISSSTVNAITLNANVNASNIVTSDGRGINQLNASNVNTGKLVIARGGTGLEAVGENVLLLGPSSGTELTKLTPYTTDSTKKFLRSNNSGVGWDDVSSTTMGTTNEESSPDDHGLIFVASAGTDAQALLKDSDGSSFGTLKYKPRTGTLTTSNVITSDTSVDARNGIANTTSTHTLSVGTVVSIQETSTGDVLIVRGNGFFNNEVYIAKKLTMPSGSTLVADTIKVRSHNVKETMVVAERPASQISI